MIQNRPFFIVLFFLSLFTLHSEIKFSPVSLLEDNKFLFNSLEYIGKKEMTKTLFYGELINGKTQFETVSFYPEEVIFYNEKRFYLQNRMGLYYYDVASNFIKEIDTHPSFTKKDEYVIHRLQKSSISPNTRYIIGKIPTSPTKSSIYLFDTETKEVFEIVKECETTVGSYAAFWSKDSNYFIYQKNNNIYYFSVSDFREKKLLSEDYRWIAKTKLENAFWTYENNLVWLEDNIIYKGDPSQFFYRGVYKSYLRMGDIVGKIPFNIESAFDTFLYNDISKKFIITKDGNSVYYYSLTNDISQNPYLQLNDNMRYDSATLFDNGEGIILIKILLNGKVSKKLFLIKIVNNEFNFVDFKDDILKNGEIYSYSTNGKEFIVNSSKGAYCYDFQKIKLLWKYSDQEVLKSLQVGNKNFLFGKLSTVLYENGKFKDIFLNSYESGGFINTDIGVIINNKSFIIDKTTKTLKEDNFKKIDLNVEEKNSKYRLLSREIKKGFYKEGVYLKDLYSGVQNEITGLPNLRYKLYQPELIKNASYFFTPDKEKYEVGLVFNCIKSAEGIFPILTTLQDFKLNATFFVNGNFIDINPLITKEISNFGFEIGNMFQYYVNLTKNTFLIDKNFIRQGLSANEEKYFKITGKNFSPYWHTPYYFFNDTIVKFGNDAGYKFVSFQLDTLDWVSETNRELDATYYMNNSQMIERILSKLKPGQIIIFNTGKNGAKREDYLFNELDLLISELVRSGYTFSIASDISERYRE